MAIDAACDLSRAFIDEKALVLLPHALEFDHRHFLDSRDAAETLEFYRRYLSDRSVTVRSNPVDMRQLRDIFLGERILQYDRVLVLTAGGAMAASATQASYAILQDYRQRRQASGRSEAFVLRVVDSGTTAAGLGALALWVLRAIESEPGSFDAIRRRTEVMARRTRCRLVPGDLARLREQRDQVLRPVRRAADSAAVRMLGVRPVLEATGGSVRVVGRVMGFERAVTRVLEWACRALANARVRPVIALSIGGDPRIVRELPAYRALESLAAERRCDLQLSVMSANLAVTYGPGAFSLGVIDA